MGCGPTRWRALSGTCSRGGRGEPWSRRLSNLLPRHSCNQSAPTDPGNCCRRGIRRGALRGTCDRGGMAGCPLYRGSTRNGHSQSDRVSELRTAVLRRRTRRSLQDCTTTDCDADLCSPQRRVRSTAYRKSRSVTSKSVSVGPLRIMEDIEQIDSNSMNDMEIANKPKPDRKCKGWIREVRLHILIAMTQERTRWTAR